MTDKIIINEKILKYKVENITTIKNLIVITEGNLIFILNEEFELINTLDQYTNPITCLFPGNNNGEYFIFGDQLGYTFRVNISS